MRGWRRIAAVAAALALSLLMVQPAFALKPDKEPRDFDGKPGWGPPPHSHHNKPNPGPPPSSCGPKRLDLCHNPSPPEPPSPDPEPKPEPVPPIIGPDGIPPMVPDTAMR